MTVRPRESFKLKLSLWIFLVAVSTFAAVFAACIYFVKQEVRSDLDAIGNAKLDYALRALDEGFSTTQVSAENLASISSSPLISHRRDSIYSLLEHFLDANPRLQGVCVGYEKGVVAGHEEGFAPYVMRTPNGFLRRDVALVRDYHNAEWYKVAHDTDHSHWTKPFVEANEHVTITAYTIPLHDQNGKVYAIAALDLNLDVVADSLQSLRPYPTAMLTVIDQEGKFVAHPNRDLIMNGSLDSLIETTHFSPNRAILDDIKAGRRGNDVYQSAEDKVFVYYAPVEKTGWTVTLEVPRSELAKGYDKMFKAMLIDMLIGLILLIIISRMVINRIAKPLEEFASAAEQISHGKFNVSLPVIKDHNELYDLRQALVSMKQSLNKYIEDLETTTKSKATIEGELNIARKIQMAMLPKIFPPYPERKDVEIHASLTPAKAVGGDLYDFILDGDDIYFCIGDVSGKGVPASLFMAITRTLFRTIAVNAKTPAKIACMMNNSIADGNDENMFVTMFIGKCNLNTGEFTCCNCGHNVPVTNGVASDNDLHIKASDQAHFMHHVPTNIPIGVIEGFEYEEVSMSVGPGVTLFLYTDGVTEAENKDKQLYGDERLIEILNTCNRHNTSHEIVEKVANDVHSHTLGNSQSDDITMMCFKYA